MSDLTQSIINFPIRRRRSSLKPVLKENKFDSPVRHSNRVINPVNRYSLSENSVGIKKSRKVQRKILGESSIHNQLNLSDNILKSPVKKIPTQDLSHYVLRTPEKQKPINLETSKSQLNFVSPIKLKKFEINLHDSKIVEKLATFSLNKHEVAKSSYGTFLKSPVKRLVSSFSPKKAQICGLYRSLEKSPAKSIGVIKPEVDVYKKLKQNLSNNIASNLVGREKEIKIIKDFLTNSLSKSLPDSIYISGAPGTGKTVSLLSIVDELKIKSLKKVYLNCMNQKSTRAIYVDIASQFNINTTQTEWNLLKCIEKAVTGHESILLILDEIDQLDSKNQSVLYTIFEWPSLVNSKLVLVGIANMLDLTDRILPRLQSNPATKPRLLHFPPYTRTQIISIIMDRIKSADVGNLEVIKPSAISFLAGKIAAVAGDIRKALDVCRRAVELTETEVRHQSILTQSNKQSPMKVLKQIDIGCIHKLFNEVYSTAITQQIENNSTTIPLQQQFIICSFLLMLKYAKSKNITISKLHEVYCKVCNKQKLRSVDQSEFLSLCFLLESRGILEIRKAKEPRNAKIMLRLSEKETEQVMEDKNFMSSIIEDKASLGKHCSKKFL